jgi:hypothetical protein
LSFNDEMLRPLGRKVAEKTARPEQSNALRYCELRTAEVVDTSTGIPTIWLSGNIDVAVPAKFLGPMFPNTGDQVWVLKNGTDLLIIGTREIGSEYKTYTPTLSASSSPPAIGNGVILGLYNQVGKTVHLEIGIVFGTTSTFGGGAQWTLSFPSFLQPKVRSAPFDNYRTIGEWNAIDDSTGQIFTGGVLMSPSGGPMVMATNASPVTTITSTVPHAWNDPDYLNLHVTYESV